MGKDKKEKHDSENEDAAQSQAHELSRLSADSLSKQKSLFTIGSLETALLKEFPSEDAEEWDRTGLLVGETSCTVKKVAVALDPTVSAITDAASAGANLLITHHPAFLSAPDAFSPDCSVAVCPGAGVWAAIQHQVALMNFHTALDVSPQVARMLPSMLGLTYREQCIDPIDSSQRKGYGQVCSVKSGKTETDTLAHLAARCTSVFGRAPRVWGNFDASIASVVTATGSAGNLGRKVLEAGIDCLICGEIKYHDALDLSQAGLCIIELGHDVSELPFVAVLADTLAHVGMEQDNIVVIDQSNNWHYPEAIRM